MPTHHTNELKGLVIDMDGVLWHGETPLPGLHDFFAVLHHKGMDYILATNNPSKTPQGFASKAQKLGVRVKPEQVITSGVATAHYLGTKYTPGTKVFVIGDAPLKDLIQAAGYELSTRDVAAVVVAMERDLTYQTLKLGTLLIRAGAEFIGTNPDPFYPSEEGILPGSGTMIAALKASTDQTPTIVGKPEPWMFSVALQRMRLQPSQVASVGDRLDTDIAGGVRTGLKTMLVLSGVTSADDLEISDLKPTWVVKDLIEAAKTLDSLS
jgi:4-nitrophenyl phosphatase